MEDARSRRRRQQREVFGDASAPAARDAAPSARRDVAPANVRSQSALGLPPVAQSSPHRPGAALPRLSLDDRATRRSKSTPPVWDLGLPPTPHRRSGVLSKIAHEQNARYARTLAHAESYGGSSGLSERHGDDAIGMVSRGGGARNFKRPSPAAYNKLIATLQNSIDGDEPVGAAASVIAKVGARQRDKDQENDGVRMSDVVREPSRYEALLEHIEYIRSSATGFHDLEGKVEAQLQKQAQRQRAERSRLQARRAKRSVKLTPQQRKERREDARRRRDEAQRELLERKFRLRDKKEEAREEARAAARAAAMLQAEQGCLASVAATARLQVWLGHIVALRTEQQDAEFALQHEAAKCLCRCFRNYLFRSHLKKWMGARTRAAISIQKMVKMHNLRTIVFKRVRAANKARAFLYEARRVNLLKSLLLSTRQRFVHIQRWWRCMLMKRDAEMVSLCRHWDKTKTWFAKRKTVLIDDVKRIKDQLSDSKRKSSGSQDVASMKRRVIAMQKELDELPKFNSKQTVPVEMKRLVLSKWLAKRRVAHKDSMRRFLVALAKYEEKLRLNAGIIQARAVMGAAPLALLSLRPPAPRFVLLPSRMDTAQLIFSGEKLLERKIRQELAAKRKARELEQR